MSKKVRLMIGIKTLDKAIILSKKLIPIATIVKVFSLDDLMHYRTAYDIIKADKEGRYEISRPEWLEDEPYIQKTPEGWNLVGGIKFGHWEYKEIIH